MEAAQRQTSAVAPSQANGQSSLVQAQGSKQFLKDAYTPGKRYFEITCFTCGLLSIVYMAVMLLQYWKMGTPLGVFVSIVGGILFADFGSGFVHWLCDSYGSVDMPVFGKAFIRSFREHHIDPLAITRHDFIECNGDNCMVVTVALSPFVAMMAMASETTISKYYSLALFFTMWGLFISFTNQFHKWSHTHTALPWWVTLMQRWHIILPKQMHHIHHVTPHATYFCITTGWLNWPLEKLRFWQGIEFAIKITTGYEARDDDMAWTSKDK